MDRYNIRSAARRAGDHLVLENAARLGYAVSGLLHLLIGWLGVQLAWGTGGGSADQSGALQALASTSLGGTLLWVAVAGFLGLGLWQLTEVLVGGSRASDRLKAAGKAAVYLVLAATSLTWARGAGGPSSSQQSVDFTASLMGQPAGRMLVVAVGLGIVGVGVYHLFKGWRRTFLRDLVDRPGPLAERSGRFGYLAKGAALVLVGLLFAVAGVRGAPGQATGLDGALRALLQAPLGQVLLTVVAAGFAAYALYSFTRARHARV